MTLTEKKTKIMALTALERALPVGVVAAIYLVEYAWEGRFAERVNSAITNLKRALLGPIRQVFEKPTNHLAGNYVTGRFG